MLNNGICASFGTWDICLATVSSESWFRFLRPEKENGQDNPSFDAAVGERNVFAELTSFSFRKMSLQSHIRLITCVRV